VTAALLDDEHEHRHRHGDGPAHRHAEPASYGPSRDGAVVVDIGGDVGALIIDTPAALAGVEIEISPAGSTRRSHVAVRERHGDGQPRHAAVFPALAAGTYTLWEPGGGARGTVEVGGARVTRIAW
jgi:hypothetical protein